MKRTRVLRFRVEELAGLSEGLEVEVVVTHANMKVSVRDGDGRRVKFERIPGTSGSEEVSTSCTEGR